MHAIDSEGNRGKRDRESPRPRLMSVTIDVEPDNVWAEYNSRSLSNIGGLPRFQDLCSRYGVRPTYLVTYSVANDKQSCRLLEELLKTGVCEIGAHPHMWEIPPRHGLDSGPTPANLYPAVVVEEKLACLTQVLRARFGPVVSHRAGRWGFAVEHAGVLAGLGYTVDTSMTPGIDWSETGAPDFRNASLVPLDLLGGRIMEVPCTVRPALFSQGFARLRLVATALRRAGVGERWLRCRPGQAPKDLVRISRWGLRNLNFLNVMTHSSELFAGTSPLWRTETAVSEHFKCYEELFEACLACGTHMVTLGEFAERWSMPSQVEPRRFEFDG